MTATASPQLRWSSTRDCPRKAVYEATGAPARERTLQEERTLYRGRSVGHDFIVALANENGWKVWVGSGPYHWVPPEMRAGSEETADVIAEMKIAWELGTGHADLYVKQTDSILEVLSSQSATAEMMHSKLVQARGYAAGIDATSIALAVVDPSTLVEDRIIVTHSSAQWDDLLEEVTERVAQVRHWNETGQTPPRVCQKPGDAWGHFCLHAAHCFTDFRAPETPVYEGDMETAQALAIRLAHAKAKRRELKQTDATLEQEQKEIQEELARVFEYGEQLVGSYKVKRSARSTRSFKLAVAEQDSRLPHEILDEFTRTTPWDMWEVEKVGVVQTVEDEDAPF